MSSHNMDVKPLLVRTVDTSAADSCGLSDWFRAPSTRGSLTVCSALRTLRWSSWRGVLSASLTACHQQWSSPGTKRKERLLGQLELALLGQSPFELFLLSRQEQDR